MKERNSFVFYQKWKWIIDNRLETDADKLAAYNALATIGLTGERPEGVPKSIVIMLDMAEAEIAGAKRRYDASVENGKKGGAPKGNKNAEKKNNPKQPKTTKNNLNEDVDEDIDIDVNEDIDISSEDVSLAPASAFEGGASQAEKVEDVPF